MIDVWSWSESTIKVSGNLVDGNCSREERWNAREAGLSCQFITHHLYHHPELFLQRVMSSAVSRKSNQGFHPFQFAEKHEPKWFLVRESYLVAVEDPASTEIFDVFLIDSSFKLQRTKRLLRQGMHLFSHTTDPADEMLQDASLINTEAAPAAPTKPEQFKDASNHTFALVSSERRLKLVAKTERQQEQFISSIEQVVAKCIFAGRNRFDSFAPLRLNASCQWLVDGRDYFWALSRAILLAKETI